MTTPILGIPELTDGQINQYLTCNEALRALESAANDLFSVNLSAANRSLTSLEFSRSLFFVVSGNTVARSLTVPAVKRFFAVRNEGTFALSVVRGTTTVNLIPDDVALFYCDGTANGLLLVSRALDGVPAVVAHTGANLDASVANAGNYTRFTGGASTYTFATSAALKVGAEYHGRNASVGALVTLVGSGGFVINPPTDGTLVIPYGGTFTVKIVASGVADLLGVTVPAL